VATFPAPAPHQQEKRSQAEHGRGAGLGNDHHLVDRVKIRLPSLVSEEEPALVPGYEVAAGMPTVEW
jgi:hypothetical protein